MKENIAVYARKLAEGEQRKVKRNRGRKRETDPKEDQRIYQGWKASGYRTFEEYATKNGLKEREVKLAVDRYEKRLEQLKDE